MGTQQHPVTRLRAIKEIVLTLRDGSGLDGIPARRRAQFARRVRPCARRIKSRLRYCPRYRRHHVMGAWICHRDRDRCAKGVSSYRFSRAKSVVELMCAHPVALQVKQAAEAWTIYCA